MCKQYSAQEALDMGWINTVVPLEQVEDVTMEWAEEMLTKSPIALRMIKASLNADTDGLAGVQQLAGDATLLYYTMAEAQEGRDAFKENGHQISINSLNSHKPMTWLNNSTKRPDHPAFIFRMNLGRFRSATRSQPLGSHISTGACTRRKTCGFIQ